MPGITKEVYGNDLAEHLTSLMIRIRRGTYQPQPARITRIPKADGGQRPLAISCIEDKLVQMAVSKILNAIYEPVFLPCSYGFRPSTGCHVALKALNKATINNWNGAIIEVDIKKYNTIPHNELMEFLKQRIADKRFLQLIRALIAMPTLENKVVSKNEIGSPQGSIVSPVLSNIYLHHVIDSWFESIKGTHIRGHAELVRYADDFVFAFQHMGEAKRFYRVLPKRLTKFGLMMHKDKSAIIPAGHLAARRALNVGKRLPTFNFLGFTCYWGKSRKGYYTLRFTSRGDRFNEKLKGLKSYLRKNLTTNDTGKVIRSVISVVVGWVNYHHISFNQRRTGAFIHHVKRYLLRWINRRGRKSPMNWDQFNATLKHYRYPDIKDFRVKSMI